MEQKSIKKNTVYNAIKTCSSIIFPLITFPYISRILLTENIGKINFGLSVVSYFSLLSSLGIATYAIRECAAVRNDREFLSKTASQIFSINILSTVAAYFLLTITLLFYRRIDNYRTLIIIQSLSIIFATLGTDWLNQAMEDFRYITIRTVSFQLISLILMFVFIHRPEDYIKYAVISILSSSGANIVNIWYRRKFCEIKFTIDLNLKKHAKPILFLFVMVLAQNIYHNMDTTMLGLMKGDWEVGIYSAAYKLQNTITQVIVSIAVVVMPRMSYYFKNNDYEQVNRLLKKVIGFYALVGLPCIVGITVIAEDVIYIAAGSSFIEATPILRILMFGFLFSLFGGSLWGNIVLIPSNREKQFMILCCFTSIINIIVNYFMIPALGVFGAALATCVCRIFNFTVLFIRKDKKINISSVAELFKTPVSGCVFIIIVCYLSHFIDSIWIRTSVSVVLSVIIYAVLQIIGKNELALELYKSGIGRLSFIKSERKKR